jgi:hypothetical protein
LTKAAILGLGALSASGAADVCGLCTTANTLTLFAAAAAGIGVSIVQGASIDGDAGAYDCC